ncbi:hypothetical protein SAY87_015462 [Trapa incisa]|uniref:RING-type E3 ubiquitin transferase n=1 Tax=Trapa incisa TaxID=236973 RepID=A0AAN7GQ66_9MYRT|nr:hypothetical protein SAY87_015462 [Trapa incisa]
MALNEFKLYANVRLNKNDDHIADSSEEDGLILFRIFYNDMTVTPVAHVRLDETTGEEIHGWKIEEQITKRNVSRQFRRSEVINSDNSAAIKTALASLAAGLVREFWVEETARQLELVASDVGDRLRDGLGEDPLATAPLLVEVEVLTGTVVKPEEGSSDDNRFFNTLRYMESLESEARSRSPFVYVPATLSSVGALATIPADRLEAGDQCAICMDELHSAVIDNGGSSESAVKMPCSHKYHRKCILQWLKENHVCPLCRFGLPHYTLIIEEMEIRYDIASA